MQLDRLRTFRMVVELESFSRAAEELFLSQPAVSLQIRQLERELGVTLLDRNGGRPTITRAGTAVLAFADHVDAGYATLKRDLTALQSEQPFVAIGCSPTTAKRYVPALAGELSRVAPGVRLSVTTLPPDEAHARLLKGELDFIMTTESHLSDRIEAECVSMARVVIVSQPTHPLANRGRVTPEEVASYPFALLPRPWTAQSHVLHWAENQGVQIQVAIELSSYDGLVQATRNGVTLTCIAEGVVARELARGELAVIRTPGFPIEFPIFLAHRAGPISKHAAAVKAVAMRLRASTLRPGAAS